jgi:RNA polymerase sigma-70 factor, ECF subfamily
MPALNEAARQKIEELFLRHAAGVSRYVRLRVGSAELAEEITARVFLTAARHVDQQNGSAVGWLWAILRTELSRHFRQRPLESCPADLPSSEALPAAEAERKEAAGLLRACLAQLPDDEQELISLKFFLGLSNQEIAQTLGLTPNHVGVRVHRVLKEMRKLLQKPLAST